MSDAFHLLSDVASFIVALAAIYLAEKPATKSKKKTKLNTFNMKGWLLNQSMQDIHLVFIVQK